MMRYIITLMIFVLVVVVPPVYAEPQVDYLAVLLQGRKVGYAVSTREVDSGRVTTTMQIHITIGRFGMPITIESTEKTIETIDGRPLGFELMQDMSLMIMQVRGSVSAEGIMEVTSASMGAQQTTQQPWPKGAVMNEGLRLLNMKKGLKPGTQYTARVFTPSVMQALDMHISIGDKQQVDLLGRVVNLIEVTTEYSLPQSGLVKSTSFVDQEYRALKTVAPLAGLNLEMIACSKEFALAETDVVDFMSSMMIQIPEPLNLKGAKAATYHLRARDPNEPLVIPDTDNQTVRKDRQGNIILTVKPVWPRGRWPFPYRGEDKTLQDALTSNRYLQSDNKRVKQMARKAVGRTRNATEAVKRIEAFVADYITQKDLSVGYASALEVIESKQGDCTEHAILCAALCRAVGIPAQVVFGIAYVEEFGGMMRCFGGHAWTRAYVGGTWVGLDAAFKGTGRGGYDPGHIALAVGSGEPGDFFGLLSILGRFRIDKVDIQR